MDLMEQNPYLRALALRNVVLLGKRRKSEFKRLLEFLCHNCPVVSSVDIKFDKAISLPTAAYILSELLATKQNVTLSLSLDTRTSLRKRQQEDQEIHKIMDSIAKETFQVKNLDIKIYRCDYPSYASVLSKLLSKCKGLESITLDDYGGYLGQSLTTMAREFWSNIQHLELFVRITSEDWATI
ncbi:hypothetical protein BGX20_007608, partial [Mortierella sp. AD010]